MNMLIEFEVSMAMRAPLPVKGEIIGSPARLKIKRCGSTRVRTGCLTCRQRRKKCVENSYPICGSCRRLHLECMREDTRILPASRSRYEDTSPSDDLDRTLQQQGAATRTHLALIAAGRDAEEDVSRIPSLSQVSVFTETPGGTRDRRYFLRYYTQVLAVQCAASHENNSFISIFLPMAFESASLLSAIVAWSSVHLSRFQSLYHVQALQHTNLALRQVASSLAAANDELRTNETDIASCIVLCSTEASAGSSQWFNHLVGAKALILSAKSRGTGGKTLKGTDALIATVEGQWLLRNFAYYDVLASVTSGEQPLIGGTYWVQDGVEILDSNMGFGSRLLGFVSEICSLQIIGSKSGDEERTGDASPTDSANPGVFQNNGDYSSNNALAQLYRLENQLHLWSPPPRIQPSLVALAEAWRHAALINLYRKWRFFLQTQSAIPSQLQVIESKIATQVECVLSQISLIPLMSLPECSILFPLFMAGGDTTNPTHIKMIRMRLWELLENRGFGNLQRASEILEEFWRLRISGIKGNRGVEVDWMDIIKKQGTRFLPS